MSSQRTLAALATLVATALTAAAPAAAGPPSIAGCPMLPADNIWNTRVDTLPVHPRSGDYIATMGPTTGLHPDFGAGMWDGGPIGIPFTTVPGTQVRVGVTFDFDDESDLGPYPIPPDAPIEGGPSSDGDRHILIVDRDSCVLYELYAAFPQPDGTWQAGSGAIFDLRSNALRPSTFTSADAAGLPILPGLVRYDEVAAGEIRHAIRITADLTQQAFVWPARHQASSSTDPRRPPMGQRFRLKVSVNIAGYPPEVRVILQALKTYGAILADNGSNWFLSGAPDPRWNDDALVTALRQVKGGDFEAVDVSSLMLDPDSGQARPPVFTGGVFVAAADLDGNGGAEIVTGAGPGREPEIRAFNLDGSPRPTSFFAYDPGFRGGVRVAACDFDGDGRAEIVTAAGPGGGPHVRVIKLDTAGNPVADLASFFAYGPAFTGGVFVACGRVEGSATPNIITGADAGGGPHVRVFRLQADAPGGVAPVVEFFAYAAGFLGGVRVAAGNVDASDRDSILLAAGPGGGPHVRALKLVGGALQDVASFFAYAPAFTGGVFVAAGNVMGGGAAEIVTGADAGGGPHVRIFGGTGADTGMGFFAYDPGFVGGVRVAVGSSGGGGQIVTAPGAGGGPHVRTFAVSGTPTAASFFAY